MSHQRCTHARRDIAVLAISTIVALAFAIYFDAFEGLVGWMNRYEYAQLDEIFFVVAGLSIAFAIFSWRRWRELKHEIKARQVIEQQLTEAKTGLETEVSERTRLLRRSEQQFRTLVETAKDYAIFMIDKQGRIVTWNKGAETISGYAPEDVIGQESSILLAPEHRGRAVEILRHAAVKSCHEEEHLIVLKDGSHLWMHFTYTALRNDEGSLTGFTLVGRDLTEQRNAQYRDLFNLANDAIVIFEPESEIILDANDKACEIYGFTREEFIGHSLKDSSKNVRRGEEHLQQLLTNGAYQAFETVQFRKDGTPIDLLINSSVIEYDGRTAVLSINRDITERKEAQEKLQQSEAWLRAIFEASRDGIMVEEDERIIFVNNAYVQMFGYNEPEELLGEPVSRVLLDEETTRLMEYGKRRAQGGEDVPTVYEFRGKRKDGTTVDIEASVSISFICGKPYITSALRDATERKRAEEDRARLEEQLKQSQKMEAIGQLAGGIAHDFNNLLTIINGYSDLLLKRLQLDDASRNQLIQIAHAGERAAGLTGQLLAYSRKQMLQPKVLDLNSVLENTQKMLRRLIGEDIELVTRLAPDLNKVKADPGQIEQVVINLAVNARDAMPKGGALVIETRNISVVADAIESSTNSRPLNNGATPNADNMETLPPGNYVSLCAADTGCGMSEEVRARIFDPFFTTKEQGKGTGLGLSTVYGIVKQSGGFIFVTSAPGAGATFTIYLPSVEQVARTPESERALPPHTNYGDARAERSNKKILLVEDETSVRKLVREVLELEGYTVIEAANGKDALDVYERNAGQIDLLLTDMVMPEMGGAELISSLHMRDARLCVVCMSGYTDKKLPVINGAGRAVTYLQKPVTPHTLVTALREALEKQNVNNGR